ncbi:MAG: penicillin-binding transpeptidase domain-containing protein [Patescibacteria group bacterium]
MKPGLAFGDHIRTEKIKRRHYRDDSISEMPLRFRGFLFPVVLVLFGLLLLGKLFSLQVVHGGKYQTLADSNRIRAQVIGAPRGVIFDRHGSPLVYNIPGFRRTTFDKKTGEVRETEVIQAEEALAQIAKGDHTISVDSLREYPYKDAMSHILGYIGQISAEEIKTASFVGYPSDAWIGKSGIEKEYEHVLRGENGQQLIEVDAMGKKVRALGASDPIPGKDITLTVDAKLQQKVYDAIRGVQKGVVIVSRPNGEILAMVSQPSYDPNLFTLDSSYTASSTSAYKTIESMLTDNKNLPLLDRAISGTYPPASTFKLVTSAAGLENKIIDKSYTITDTGVLKVGEFSYANWYFTDYGKKEEGSIDVSRALARSNDIFFYKLAEKVTVEKLSAMAKKVGIGKPLGIDLPGEAAGLVPSKNWKEEEIGEKWFLGDTFHYGIGQGYLLTTPLQVNAWTQVIANGGDLYQPYLLQTAEKRITEKNILSEKAIEPIRQGMIDACTEGKGVAFPLYGFNVKNAKLPIDNKNIMRVASGSSDMRQISVACKTGTAQHGGEKTLPHAWITLFAPAYNPEVVVTVLVEESGEGSKIAAPVAKKVLEGYFSR